MRYGLGYGFVKLPLESGAVQNIGSAAVEICSDPTPNTGMVLLPGKMLPFSGNIYAHALRHRDTAEISVEAFAGRGSENDESETFTEDDMQNIFKD